MDEQLIKEVAKNQVLLLEKFDVLIRRDAEKARLEKVKKYLNMVCSKLLLNQFHLTF